MRFVLHPVPASRKAVFFPGTPTRSLRCRSDHRFERHRRRHSVLAAAGRGQRASSMALSGDVAGRRGARVRRSDGVRRARDAAAAIRRRVRLSRRGVRPSRGVPDRLDLARRRSRTSSSS